MANYENQGAFYDPAEADLMLGEIGPGYRAAFGKESIWGEESKCAALQPSVSCPGGLSRVAVGEVCTVCTLRPTQQAYPDVELAERFKNIAATRSAAWYMERSGGKLAMAAFAWRATSTQVAAEKYADNLAMAEVLPTLVGKNVVWLDEVFADRSVRPKGNLANFVDMSRGFNRLLGDASTVLAFRTINPAMVRAAQRVNGCRVFKGGEGGILPDRRDLVVIDMNQEAPLEGRIK